MSYDEDNMPIKAVQFEYPSEDPPTVVDDTKITQLLDFMIYYILTSKNPQLTLAALGYAAGYDVGDIFSTQNTARSISQSMGVVPIQFHRELQRIKSQLGLSPRINNGNR